MFHMKIELKPRVEAPLLREILSFLEIGFNHILLNLKKFYKAEDHNIAFLTLFQEPMINGLNTGGFDIQESAFEMVDRVLKMLEQFLVSNQTLKLDKTFKVYVKILSIEHIKDKNVKKQREHAKRTKKTYRKHYGARNKTQNKYNYYWAIDVPNSFPNASSNVFKNKCLLTTTILGLLQHKYFEGNREDKRFLHIQNINSQNREKQNHAGRILLNELNKLIEETNLPKEGPYDLQETVQKLSEKYRCQFFIFENIFNTNKLNFMYPSEYDDSLKPIYLFEPFDAKNHLIFIRNLNSYFKANVKVCFACKKIFLTHNYRHLCPKLKCCFSCRRFFQSSTTYIHEKLKSNFCDKNITTENSFTCSRCNVTCFSKHCFNGHKLFCSGKGSFGYKCLLCNKFTYRYGSKKSSDALKDSHKCGENKRCLYCRETKDSDHLCKFRKETILSHSRSLAFINMEFYCYDAKKCLDCLQRTSEKNSLFCEKHENLQVEHEPLLIVIYKEEKYRGNFSKYEINNFIDTPVVQKTQDVLTLRYDDNLFNNKVKNSKIPEDFKTNYEKIQNDQSSLLSNKLLQLIMSKEWQNTTFICQDADSLIYVSIFKLYIYIDI